MLRAIRFVVGGLLVGSAVLVAQDAASEVRKTMEAQRAAAVAKDAKAYERFLADDLRWVGSGGVVSTKQDRLKGVPSSGPIPAFGEPDINVFGDTATVISIQTGADSTRSRVARTYVKRDGRWQLVLFASVPMK